MEATDRLKTLTMLVYALQAAGFLLPPVVWIVAVIINYVRKDEVAGTWLESRGRRDLDHLPHRQGLAQSLGEPADALGKRISSG